MNVVASEFKLLARHCPRLVPLVGPIPTRRPPTPSEGNGTATLSLDSLVPPAQAYARAILRLGAGLI